jgi:hypothetical protein
MGRRKNQQTSTAAPIETAGASTDAGTNGAAPKKSRPRKTEDEIIAECKAKIAEAETKKAIKQMGTDNKPLAAALKALMRLRGWISNATYEDAFAQINAKAARLAAQAAAVIEPPTVGSPTDDADDDEIPASPN